MSRIVTSFSAKARIESAAQFIENFPAQQTLCVAAQRTAADDLVRSIACRSGGSFGVHRFTLPALAVEIASGRLASTGLSILSGVAREALAARSVDVCRSQGELAWFEPVANTPGFFRALASTISELRMNEVDNARLDAAGPAGKDLARLSEAFAFALKEARIADLAAVYKIASETSPSRYSGMPALLLDVTPKSSLELEFLRSFTRDAPEVLATAHCRNEAAIEKLEIILGARAQAIPEGRTDRAIDRLQRNIFTVAAPPKGGFDDTTEFSSATDEGRETVEVARSILLHAGSGTSFDRIAVLLRNPESYQPLLEDAMRRAGIPAFYTLGTRRPNAAGRAFLALLACALEGLSASRFSEYLSLAQVPEPESEPPPVWVPVQGELFPDTAVKVEPSRETGAESSKRAPYAWERLLVDSAVIGGIDRWERRLAGLDRELLRQIDEVRAEDENLLHYLELKRARLNDLQSFSLPLIRRLAALPSEVLWGEWLDALEDLASRSLKQPELVLSALAELRPMSATGPVKLDEVVEVLSDRLTFLRAEPAERRYGKVFVSTIAEASGMSFDTVFLPGVGEDIFPKRAFEDPLLLDEARLRISPELAHQDTRFSEERLLLHIAMSAAENRICISFPRMNMVQGRARGPSFYALEVVRAITGRVPDLTELHRRAVESSHAQAGWPSPRDPAVAIDDAEYDVAIVSRFLRASEDEARGRARYLMNANDRLARSLRARHGRWLKRWTPGDGIVSADPLTIEALASHRPESRPYSATALQHFASCPYRFALYSIHRLQPRDEIDVLEKMDPLTRGSLFHSIQFRLLSELRLRELLPITSERLSGIFTLADRIIDETAGTYREELAPALPRIWDGEVEDIRWDIRGWIREMTTADAAGWVPRWFELSFGLPPGRECDERSRPDVIDLPGLHLRGSIDMIEERAGRLRITDHKTGRPPMRAPGMTGGGELLQPVLYAMAAQAMLGAPVESARLFYCTHRGGYRRFDFPVDEASGEALGKVVQAIDGSLRAGFLPAAPREGACAWCDYRIVCGPYEEMRVRRKPPGPLSTLKELRETP